MYERWCHPEPAQLNESEGFYGKDGPEVDRMLFYTGKKTIQILLKMLKMKSFETDCNCLQLIELLVTPYDWLSTFVLSATLELLFPANWH